MKLFTDGGARGNPGPSAIGIVIKDGSDNIIYEAGKYLGTGTNNEAEYKALIGGLLVLKEKKVCEAECFLDSELVVKQINGQYKVKDSKLKELYAQAVKAKGYFTKITFNHIPRTKNKEADALVNKTLDSQLR